MKRSIAVLPAAAVLLVAAILFCALPAAAYTDQEPQPITLEMQLVEATTDIMGGFAFDTPVSGRTYARNEVVCAVITMHVPKGVNPVSAGYTRLQIGGKGIALDIIENFPNGLDHPPALIYGQPMPTANYSSAANSFFIPLDEADGPAGTVKSDNLFYNDSNDATYAVAVFFKLVAEDAELRATLTGAGFLADAENPHISTMQSMSEEGDLLVTRNTTPLQMRSKLYINKTLYDVDDIHTGDRLLVIADGDDTVRELVVYQEYLPGKHAEYRVSIVRGRLYFFLQTPGAHRYLPGIVWEGSADAQHIYQELAYIYQSLAVDRFSLDLSAPNEALQSYFAEASLREANVIADLPVRIRR